MKTKITLLVMAILLLLFSCFEDEGNYEYTSFKEPTFEGDYQSLQVKIGDTLKMSYPFKFDCEDSTEIMNNCEYLWVIEDIEFSHEREINLPVDTLMKKLNLNAIPLAGLSGYFQITNKKTGDKYANRIYLTLNAKYPKGTWRILSENKGNSKLCYIKYIYKGKDNHGFYIFEYENFDSFFKEKNDGMEIPGNPIALIDYTGKHISSKYYATTIITDQIAWDMNNENFAFAYDLNTQFTGAAPSNLHPTDIYCKNQYTYLINSDGKIYTRTMSENYLGGKFVNIPYVVDEKGYKAKMFATPSNYSDINFVYDEKNSRLLGIGRDHKISPLERKSENYDFDVTNIPDDVEVLSISRDISYFDPNFTWPNKEVCMITYNRNGETYISEFVVNKGDFWRLPLRGLYFVNEASKTYKLPVHLNSSDIIFPLSYSDYNFKKLNYRFKFAVFFTHGNSLKYYDREDHQVHDLYTFNSRITAARMDTYYHSYINMGIGLENGDFLILDFREGEPYIIPTSRFNTGGKVTSVSLLGGLNNG